MRTILKEIGKEQDLVLVGNRLVHKRHNTGCDWAHGTVAVGQRTGTEIGHLDS